MKRWIHAASEITPQVLSEVEDQIKSLRGSYIDRDNHVVVVPFPKGFTEEEVMQEGMLGDWFVKKGFQASFEQGDHEYITQPEWINYRGSVRSKGHKAYLRDRLIGKFTW